MSHDKLNSLATPCLIIDEAKLKNNISTMKNHLDALGVKIRPHVKTTKSTEITRLIFNGGTGPITVSTLKEAEHFFADGFKDIIYAVSIVPHKLPRAYELINQGADLKLITDNLNVVKALSEFATDKNTNFKLFVEIDSDNHRAGLAPSDPKVLELVKLIEDLANLSFEGFLTHAGESYNCQTTKEIANHAELERDAIKNCAKTAEEAGIKANCLSMGSSPTAKFSTNLSGIDEVRAGIFVLQDLVQAGLNCCEIDDIALSVLTTVISHKPEHNRIIVDAGGLALSKDRGTQSQANDYGFGLVVDEFGSQLPDGLFVESANQEHGIITSKSGKINFEQFPIGSLLRVLPNHACMTASAYGGYNIVNKNNKVFDFWPRCNGW